MGSAKFKWSLVVRWKSAVKTLSIGMGAAGINLKWLFASGFCRQDFPTIGSVTFFAFKKNFSLIPISSVL